MLLLSRIEKKDRSVRQGIRALKNCAAFGQSTKAARKNKKYATQVVRCAKQAKEKVISAHRLLAECMCVSQAEEWLFWHGDQPKTLNAATAAASTQIA